MVFALHVIVMSSAFFNPSFAFSSHFDTGKGQTEGFPISNKNVYPFTGELLVIYVLFMIWLSDHCWKYAIYHMYIHFLS